MHAKSYLAEASSICQSINHDAIDRLAARLSLVKGRIYVAGLGGSMANAIHMAADLRKLCNLDAEAFSNIVEITARMNDEGPATIFENWIAKSTPGDALFVLSVGGGTGEVSPAITRAVERCKDNGTPIFGITGPDGGTTAQYADICIKVPVLNRKHITPHTEAFQAVVWHCLVSHPLLQKNATKW